MKSESEILLVFLLIVILPLGPIAMAAKWNRGHEEARMDTRIAEMQKELASLQASMFSGTNKPPTVPDWGASPFGRQLYDRFAGRPVEDQIRGDMAMIDSGIYQITSARDARPNAVYDIHSLRAWLTYWLKPFEQHPD